MTGNFGDTTIKQEKWGPKRMSHFKIQRFHVLLTFLELTKFLVVIKIYCNLFQIKTVLYNEHKKADQERNHEANHKASSRSLIPHITGY